MRAATRCATRSAGVVANRAWLTLLAIPALVFTLPALADRPLLDGDNLIQNYPLRVLVGTAIRQGRMPLWDAYLSSGTPLLAGFNAGAAYPATWLFAVLPSKIAWGIDQGLAYVSAALGMYAFLRLLALIRGVAALGGATFAFSGYMSSQIVHLDLVTGAALIPWALVAVHQVAYRSASGRGWRWVALLALVTGLLMLAGSPEAALYGGTAVAIYALAALWRHRDLRLRILLMYVVGIALGMALAGVQLVPGMEFAAHSQRATSTYAFFSSGSLQPNLLILGIVPYLLGGYGRLGLPQFMGPGGLNELNSYVGLLPLIAAFALLSRRWWRHPAAADYRVWYVVIAVGLLLSTSSSTPLGHLLFHIPVYGSQRLQNRNLLEVDLGLSVLFACWLQRICSPDERYALPPRLPPSRLRHRLSQLLPTVPVIGVAVVFLLFVLWGNGLEQSLGAVVPGGPVLTRMLPYMVVTLVLALVAGALAVAYRRIPLERRLRVFGMFVVVDLLVFTANQSLLVVAPLHVVNGDTIEGKQLADMLPSGARYAIYNPTLYDYEGYLRSGAVDLNILDDLHSVQGYGSLVRGSYQNATGSHDQGSLYPPALRTTTFDRLNMALLLTRPEYFYRPVVAKGDGNHPPAPSISSTLAPPPPEAPLPPVAPGDERTWYLGGSLLLTRVSVRLVPASAPGAHPVDLGVRAPDGTIEWATPGQLSTSGDGTVTASLGHEVTANAVVVRDLSVPSLRFQPPQADSVEQGEVVLDGSLQDDVKPPHWIYQGAIGGLAVFANTDARGTAWLENGHGDPLPGGSVRLQGDDGFGEQTFTVSSPAPAELVRSVAAEPGWSARVQPGRPPGRGAVSRPVADAGLVQSVAVPAGTSTITFHYDPGTVTAGLAVSLAAFGFSVLVVAGSLARRRLRPSGRGGSSPPST